MYSFLVFVAFHVSSTHKISEFDVNEPPCDVPTHFPLSRCIEIYLDNKFQHVFLRLSSIDKNWRRRILLPILLFKWWGFGNKVLNVGWERKRAKLIGSRTTREKKYKKKVLQNGRIENNK
jgi:hypothetical protein